MIVIFPEEETFHMTMAWISFGLGCEDLIPLYRLGVVMRDSTTMGLEALLLFCSVC